MGLQISSSVTITPTDLILAECAAFIWVTYLAYNYFTTAYKYHLTTKKGQQRRAARDAKKFKFPSVPPEKGKKILAACGDVALLRNLQINGEVSSVDIVSFFAQRCHTIGRKLNLVTEEYYNEALDEARYKDLETTRAIGKKKTNELGPLHGLPISIKDHVDYY